jgi:L-threonylcarbamoyladenylate synthase
VSTPNPSELIITDPGRAADVLLGGGLLGLPTETVYGLGALTVHPDAVARVYAVKGRPADHPLIVHVRGADDLELWGRDVPGYARTLARHFWPGPLTLIVRRSPLAGDHVTGGQDTVGLRAPSHPAARAVLQRLHERVDGGTCGVAAPSANRFGRVSPTTAQHVVAELGDRLVPGVDAVLDGGPSEVGVESTILDCTGPTPVVLRPGAVTAADVERTTGLAPRGGEARDTPRAPGTLAAHYAPNAVVHLVSLEALDGAAARLGSPLSPVGVLAPESAATPSDAVRLASPPTSSAYAAQLYAALRKADVLRLGHVVVVPPPDDGVGSAVLDRLRRAAFGSGGSENLTE